MRVYCIIGTVVLAAFAPYSFAQASSPLEGVMKRLAAAGVDANSDDALVREIRFNEHSSSVGAMQLLKWKTSLWPEAISALREHANNTTQGHNIRATVAVVTMAHHSVQGWESAAGVAIL